MSRAQAGIAPSLGARAVQQHKKKISSSFNQKEYLIRLLNAVNFKSFPVCCHAIRFYVFFATIAKRPCVSRLWCVFRICHLVPSLTVCSRADCSLCVPMISTPVKCTELHSVQDVRVALSANNVACPHLIGLLATWGSSHLLLVMSLKSSWTLCVHVSYYSKPLAGCAALWKTCFLFDDCWVFVFFLRSIMPTYYYCWPNVIRTFASVRKPNV